MTPAWLEKGSPVRKDGKEFSVTVWSAIALGAVGIGVIVAFLAGYFLGHFTGHEKTTTVSAVTAPSEAGSAEESTATTEEVSSAPGAAWTTPNGNPYNQRVANSEIDSSNAPELGVAWQLPIKSSVKNSFNPAGQFGYFASTPITNGEGTVYFQDAASNVFAVNLETGEEIWRREYNMPNEGPNGVTLDEGNLYGCTSTFCFALEAETGKELWHTGRLVDTEAEGKKGVEEGEKYGAGVVEGVATAGQGMNSAPQVHDGKVFVSTSGQPTGGEAIALDQETGKVLWTLNETKEKKDRGVGGAAGTGGAWNAAAIGPDGTVYYGIGNPYRSNAQAIEHPTELLYNDSTIAVDPESGEVKWYMQGIPNDFYDWDMQISPIVVEEDGSNVILDGGKMGYVYAMEEGSGKLLWKTAVGKHNGHDEDGKLALEGKFHPKYPYKIYPGGLGGVETNMAASEGVVYAPIVNAWQEKNEPETIFGDHSQELTEATGAIAAIEISTGKKLWETELPQIALGAATVSNDLVFTALFDGTVVAVNRETGKVEWEEKLPGPSNSPLVIEGDTLIAINSIPTGGKPQIVAWKLGATGSVESEGAKPAEEKGSAENESGKGQKEAEAESKSGEQAGAGADVTAGKTAFTTNCASCHTLSEAGTHGNVGPNLDELEPEKSLVEKQVTNGGGGMPAFGGTLSKEEIEDIAEYVSKAAGTGNDTLGGKSTGGGGV